MKKTLGEISSGIPPATQLHGTRSKVVPVHAIKAYKGAEVQLHSLTLALQAG
jgi:hypothetical protein